MNQPNGNRNSIIVPVSGGRRRAVYLIVGAAVLVLIVVGLVAFDHADDSDEASDKADQLIAAFDEAGLTAPDKDRVVKVLGEDGGAMCDDPGHALKQAIANQVASGGAAGPGQRPGPMARELIEGEILTIDVYCPAHLPAFLEYVDGLDLHDLTED